VTSVAVLTRAASQGSASQDALVANVQAQRSSATEVSIDEEMVSLIKGNRPSRQRRRSSTPPTK